MLRNINWLAIFAVLMMIGALVCAALARSYSLAGIVLALSAIGVSILVVADNVSRSKE